jgi:Periplasmic binding protein domain
LYHRTVTLLKKTFPSGAGFWLFFRKGEITLGRCAEVRFQLRNTTRLLVVLKQCWRITERQYIFFSNHEGRTYLINQLSFMAPNSKVVMNSNHHISKIVRIGKVGKNGLFEIVNSTSAAVNPLPWISTSLQPRAMLAIGATRRKAADIKHKYCNTIDDCQSKSNET